MGEFGFITADDVYHVTVYATDENGNFKIISMKNVKLMKGPMTQIFGKSALTSTTPQPFMVKTTTAKTGTASANGEPACASCSLPKKPDSTKMKPSAMADSTIDNPPPFKIFKKADTFPSEPPLKTIALQPDALPQKIINDNRGNSFSSARGSNSPNGNNQFQPYTSTSRGSSNNDNQQSPNSQQLPLNMKLNSPKFFNKQGGNVEYYNKMEKLMNGLLYRFNYTTDFQGHNEEGDRLGNKNGEYFSVGRDNIKRIVSYKANEFGFMPFIRQETINPQYYDENNNRLRGYNFEWFYP
ncbi:CLUMA_CG016948, isoform A [Clunio marinus]|uniref:CLUMA_CG016948, isoform A n=1 Tax=Clunio marinus TaxID=568069 RepID=A0A1J1IWP2_9DIPT|nr:CLUMA_CG016948, isoform A [Clunio marinus]